VKHDVPSQVVDIAKQLVRIVGIVDSEGEMEGARGVEIVQMIESFWHLAVTGTPLGPGSPGNITDLV